jgi:glycosyltransferase 2 family protein
MTTSPPTGSSASLGPAPLRADETLPPLGIGVSTIQKILFAVGTVLAAYFIYLIVRQVDFYKLVAILRHSNPLFIALGFATIALAYVFRTGRLHFIVSQHSRQSTLGKCAKAILVGVAINNIYPFRLGDVYRVVAFRSLLGIDGAKMLGALVIERIIDLICILLFLALALALSQSRVSDSQVRFWILVLTCASILAFVLMLFTPRPLRQLLALFRPGIPILGAVLRFADSLLEGVASAMAPRSIVVIFAIGLAGWTVELAVFSWVVGKAVGLDARFAAGLLGLVLGNLSALFPNVPGYVGTLDYFMVLGITSAGGDPNQAAAFAIVAHAILWLFTTGGGLLYFAVDRYRRFHPPSVAVNAK